MTKTLNEKKAEIFKALSNPIRLDVVDVLLNGEKCVCEIIEELKKYEQPNISKSLAKLKSVGIITSRKEGSNVYYKLSMCCIEDFIGHLNKTL
ncbi:MAG: metalloregulator ArsR/SmtB family transcription factor [Candidatus Gastranaerophilales bacterium]|nr:metalloregulator ArsR/SmtB family transcription factor [Candidatus Gastranaerophilales bacterium]MCM1072692.1 metalloregulator ArsR/SmtB family transcription factor [Bacteroides sp.]